uniref:Reverse transcriptase domain-containing protein n=1 Tax=Anopheles minimus TaxID=112268 RepID=A0A182W7W3_9DIPT
MVFGTTLRIPSEFFVDAPQSPNEAEFVENLRRAMRKIRPRENRKHSIFMHRDLQTCKNVFVRNDSVRPLLSPPYEGPFAVINRTDKYFKVKMRGRTVNISVDRLKPPYTLESSKAQLIRYPQPQLLRQFLRLE